jgi:DNA recombination protein RmuC
MELWMGIVLALLGLGLGALIAGGAMWARMRPQVAEAHLIAAREEARANVLEQQLAASAADLEQRQQLQTMLGPVQQSLRELSERSERAHEDRMKAEAAIAHQLTGVKDQYASIGGTTQQIAAALTKGQTRGQWGEMQLEQLLTHAGLIEGVHFRRQDDRNSEIGKQRPDIVIMLPGDGEVYVDAKFPFDAYWQALGSDDPEVRQQGMTKHAKDVQARATELSHKGYSKGGKAADFVVMFLPFESLLSAALDADGTLLERTFERRVVLATPTTMLALLRTISFGYDRAAMAANAEEIQRQGMEMLNRLGTLIGHVELMRKGIAQSVDGFNKFLGSFESQALSQARRMRDLGVQAPKPIEAPEPIREELREVRQPEAS